MHNWQRTIAYVTGAFVLGLLLIVISNSYLQFVAYEGMTGYLVQLGFGLVFLNLTFGISRRFVIKEPYMDWACYLMAVIILAPTLFWIYTKDVGLADTELVFVLTIIFAALLGSYFGIRRGKAKRAQYIRQMQEDEDSELPDELKGNHNEVKKN